MRRHSKRLSEVLTEDELRRLAGAAPFARGADYQAQRRVRSLTEYRGAVTASVQGTRDYTVKLWIGEGGGIGYSCTCPMGVGGAFCKHCVAVALEVLAQGHRGASPGAGSPVTMEDVRARLLLQDKESLVELLMEEALEHADFRRRLLLEAAKDRPGGLDLTPFFAAVDEAAGVGDFVPYGEAYAYASDIGKVVSSLRELVTERHASEAIELIEYAISKVERAMGSVDDSNGDIGGVLADLQALHHEACVQARPDPRRLAEKLFWWEMRSDWEVFLGAAGTYADVLGEAGLARYRELAEAEWQKVAPLSPGQREDGGYSRRWRITNMMEVLARLAGDVDALIEIMARDLSTAYHFLEIAQVCKEARRHEEAMQWAERGVAAFPERTDWRLREFLAEEYHRLGRHDEAMKLVWAEFAGHPNLGLYQLLKKHADRPGHWPAWREKALAQVRESIAQEKARLGKRAGLWHGLMPNNSLLVEILLWEKDVEGAWQEAQAGGCRGELWMELAEKREKEHPEDSLPIYRSAVEPAVQRKNNDAYQEAVRLLHKVNKLMVRLNRSDEFHRYLASLRNAHKLKRNFLKLLDAARWTR